MTRRTEEEAAARATQHQQAGEALRAERPNKKFHQTLKEIENDHQEEA